MRSVLLIVSTLLGISPCLGGEAYPGKLVRVVVSYAPGGFADLVGRVISQQLSKELGKSFVVENRTGAAGTIGFGSVARSAPDGYTLSIADAGWAITPSLNKSVPYDVLRDFTPVTLMLGVPNVLVVTPALNVSTLKAFIALAQAHPGKFNYGSSGIGGQPHLAAELFNRAARVNLVNVAFKGGTGEVVTALISGQVQMEIASVPTMLPYVRSGKLLALAVTTDGKRVPSMPDVPSMSEAGISGMAIYLWVGMVGPAGMPREVVNKLHSEVVKALAVPAVKDSFSAQAAEVIGSSPEEFSSYIRSEVQRWTEAIRSAGITPE